MGYGLEKVVIRPMLQRLNCRQVEEELPVPEVSQECASSHWSCFKSARLQLYKAS